MHLDRIKLASPFEHSPHSSPERFPEYYKSANFLIWSSLLASQFELVRLQNPPLIFHSLLRCYRNAVVEFCFFSCRELTSSQAAFKDFVTSFNSSLTDVISFLSSNFKAAIPYQILTKCLEFGKGKQIFIYSIIS